MNPRTIIFFGKQGSGKGTQANLLHRRLEQNGGKVFHFQTGNAFRDFSTGGSYTSNLVKESLPGGHIQPLFIAVWLWADAFVKNLSGGEHLIADGFPRRVMEAQILDAAFELYGRKEVDVVNLTLDNDIALERMLQRGRADDTKEGISERLEWHDREATPVVEYFRALKRYTVHDIDASGTVEEIETALAESLSLL